MEGRDGRTNEWVKDEKGPVMVNDTFAVCLYFLIVGSGPEEMAV